jgi:hypothetical protein
MSVLENGSEFQTIASETFHGLNMHINTQRNVKGNRRDGLRTFLVGRKMLLKRKQRHSTPIM